METILVNLLAPFLVHLVQAGQRAGARAADELASDAGRLAGRIWDRLRDRVEARPAAKEAVADAAARPTDSRARGSLELQLEKLLEQEPGLREELAALVAEGQRSGIVSKAGTIAIGGYVKADHGSSVQIATGDITSGDVTGGDSS